jgi:hypothetical protein
VPTAYEEISHKVDPSIPSLGSQHGAGPSMHHPTQLVVRKKLFLFDEHCCKVKTKGGAPFGHDLKTRGNAFDQMVLLNGRNTPVAVCVCKSVLFGQAFKIYSTHPLYPGQQSSDRKYNQYALYTYAKVERVPLSTQLDVTFDSEPSPSYTVHRERGLGPTQKRVVRRHGQSAALMEAGTWEKDWDSYLLTINPGIDPCLVVCLFAICDEMDEARK